MYTCTILVNGCRIRYVGTRDLKPAFDAILQGIEFRTFNVIRSDHTDHCDAIVQYIETNHDVEVRYSESGVTISAPWHMVRGGGTLVYAAFPLIEKELQQRGFMTMHAAAVSAGGTATLLLGKVGSGKTSSALEMCRRYGCSLIGNDIVVVGAHSRTHPVVAEGGSQFFLLRYESIRRNLPDLLPIFSRTPKDPWLHKETFPPEDLGIEVCTRATRVSSAYIVHVDESKSDVIVQAANPLISRLNLNENCARYIRGSCLSIFDDRLRYLGYVPSYDCEAFFRHRAHLIDRFFDELSLTHVSGPLEGVVDHIMNQ